MPTNATRRQPLRICDRGVRIPGYVGTWNVSVVVPAKRGGEDVFIAVCRHDKFADGLAVDAYSRKVIAIVNPGWKENLKDRGIEVQ